MSSAFESDSVTYCVTSGSVPQLGIHLTDLLWSEISHNGKALGSMPGTEHGLSKRYLLLLVVIGSASGAVKVVVLSCLGDNYKMIN